MDLRSRKLPERQVERARPGKPSRQRQGEEEEIDDRASISSRRSGRSRRDGKLFMEEVMASLYEHFGSRRSSRGPSPAKVPLPPTGETSRQQSRRSSRAASRMPSPPLHAPPPSREMDRRSYDYDQKEDDHFQRREWQEWRRGVNEFYTERSQHPKSPPRWAREPVTPSKYSNKNSPARNEHVQVTGEPIVFNKYLARQNEGNHLPTFSGDPTEWPNFISEYRRTTEDCGFSMQENLTRLRKCLTGEAKKAVYALLALPKAVPEIITTLEQRFGRPEFVVGQLAARLLKEVEISEGNYQGLIAFNSELKNYVITVQILECPEFLVEPSMMAKLLRKLPGTVRVQWGEYVTRREHRGLPKIDELSRWLDGKAQAYSVIAGQNFLDNLVEDEKKPRKSAESSRQGCKICFEGNHPITECDKWKKESVSSRWKHVGRLRLCYRCLKGAHAASKCQSEAHCGVCNSPRHHSMLHKTTQPTKPSAQPCAAHMTPNTGNNPQKWCSVLKVLPVRVYGPKGTSDTFALLDEGSSLTMIEASLAQEIGVEGLKKPLSLAWTGDVVRTEEDSQVVRFQISKPCEGARQYSLCQARTVEKLALQPQTVNVEALAEKWPYIKKGEVVSLAQAVPKVIIGQDNWPLLLVRKSYYGPWRGPVVSLTWLGWVLYGNIPEKVNTTSANCQTHFQLTHWSDVEIEEDLQEEEDRKLSKLVAEFMHMDRALTTRKKLMREDDHEAVKIFEATTRRVGRRWETGLLWRPMEKLPESRKMAERRLRSLDMRFSKDPAFAARYREKMEENFTKGYARYLTNEEAAQEGPRTWYLPHLGVVNPNKPQKLRVCFDASAQSNGFCLNDLLYKGPDLYVALPGLLLNFRRYSVAFTGDIKEMYPQIRIRAEDQDGQRFLWRSSDGKGPVRVAVMQAMMFGAICSPYAAQQIRTKNAEEYKDEFPEAYEAISKRHYMDDYVDCVATEEEAIQQVTNVIEVHSRGGFVMCNWVSNSQAVLEAIPVTLRDPARNGKCKILGMTWNYDADKFEFSHWEARVNRALTKEKGPTKREILRLVMSLFDPLGLLSHLVIPGRILFQDVWTAEGAEKEGWDKEVEGELWERWRRWLSQLETLTKWTMPRQLSTLPLKKSHAQIHIFCDASSRAYSAAAYLRLNHATEVDVTLLCARARVAPVEATTIPRLELRGAQLAVEIGQFLQAEFELAVERLRFWTDSQVVLHWITGTKQRYKMFVANRVAEILEGSTAAQWQWVPTADNPADIATRECADLADGRWFKGPSFLYKSEEEWPTLKQLKIPSPKEMELVGQIHFVGLIQLCTATAELPDVNRFSKWLRLVRATAWIIRLKWNAKNPKKFGELEVTELAEAETLWCIKVQQDSFQKELGQLQRVGEVTDTRSRLIALNPFLDERTKLIRVQGRLGKATGVNSAVKTPIILDPQHRYTRLLMQHVHEKAAHCGRRTVFNEIRQRFWVLQGFAALRRIWNDCIMCQIRRAKAKTLQVQMGELPVERVAHHVRPFTNVGLDYFGPVFTVTGRRREKRYGALFTCLSTRAIHLEMAFDLSTDSALMAIRRFASRRGMPSKIFSDNGTNFVGANHELQRCLAEWDNGQVQAALAIKGIEWNFNPPSAPHMGGSWERMVRSVKEAMEAILRNQTPRDEVLLTVFAEVEAMVNSRPLTEISLDSADEEPLTPNHFLIGAASVQPMIPPIPPEVCLKRAWRTAQQLADQFWQSWVRTYLPTLLTRPKWREDVGKVRVGDVVVIVDGNSRRGTWPKGVVTRCYPGSDGRSRVVDIRTARGVLRRPTTKVCPLRLDEGKGVVD